MTSSSSTALVTGGAGFIGCAISAGLTDRFSRVIVLDCFHPQIHERAERPEGLDPRVHLQVGDVCDPSVWDEILSAHDPEVIVHLAAETGTGQSLTHSTRHTHTNVTGTATMVDALARNGRRPRRIVLSSSRAVYGEGAWTTNGSGNPYYPGQRMIEQLERQQWNFDGEPLAMKASAIQPRPVSVYGSTKLSKEQILSVWCNAMKVQITTLRLQNVYGPGQSLINSYTGIVSLFCQMARRGERIPLYEDGKVIRDFVLIDDVAEALLAAVDVPDSANGQTVDIGCGVKTTLQDIANAITANYSAPAPRVTGQYRPGDVRHAYADISAARDILGWTPRHSVTDGLCKLARWIEQKSK